jgi:purine-binding chemotaxis protein CheW
MESALVPEGSIGEKKEGKHLIFQLEERDYGVPILTVNEIIGIMDITPLPKAPEFIKGVINLRGKIIPVMDLRLKFGMPEKEHTEETCIIIVNVQLEKTVKQIGVVVDIVSEVVDIAASDIEAAPRYGDEDEQDFLSGVGKIKGKVAMLLNIEKIIYSEAIIGLLEEKEVNNDNNK